MTLIGKLRRALFAPEAETAAAAPPAPMDETVAAVRAALSAVIDPEIGYNIVDIGLIYDIAISGDGEARIVMTTTTRGCPATNYLAEAARTAALDAPGVRAVEIRMTWEPAWSLARLSDAARAHLRGARGRG
jgi:metal-sulfur cluster biosynthetic enzyme